MPRETSRTNATDNATNGTYHSILKEYCIFTGDLTTENVKVNNLQIITSPPTRKWVKIFQNKNCMTNKKEDFMVWCLQTEPATYESITILIDTTHSKRFVIKKILTYE